LSAGTAADRDPILEVLQELLLEVQQLRQVLSQNRQDTPGSGELPN
jgi:hypothetical protein